jgi:hypothetical protein
MNSNERFRPCAIAKLRRWRRTLPSQLIVGVLLVIAAVAGSASAQASPVTSASALASRAGSSDPNQPGLATAALPASALPGSTIVTQGYASKSDLVAAGPGITAGYERMFDFPNSNQLVFLDEELFAASSPDAAAGKFNRLRHATSPAALQGLESLMSNMFLITVVLPVRVQLQRIVPLHVGDSSFELLFAAHSYCCKFRVTAAVIRVGQLDAVLIVATNGEKAKPALVSRLTQLALTQISAATAAPPPPAATLFSDPSGDSGAAPDITSVAVSNTQAGQITFQATIANESTLSPGAVIFLSIDSDQNPATGSPTNAGADYYLIIGLAPGVTAARWDGSTWVYAPLPSATVSYANGVATFSVNRSDLGNPTGFNFYLDAQADTSNTSAADFAPDSGVWNYQLH